MIATRSTPALAAAVFAGMCTLSSLLHAQAAETRVHEYLSEAEALQSEGRSEDAARVLRDALDEVAKITEPPVRRTLQKKVDNQLKKVDPLHAEASRWCAAASRALALAADTDIKRGWLRYARRLIDTAERLVPVSTVEQQASLTVAQASGDGAASRAPADGGSLLERWFRAHENPMGEGGWSVTADRVTSPATGGRSIMIASGKAIEKATYTLRFDVRAAAAPGKYAVVFGLTEELQYHLLELRTDFGFAELRLFRWDGRQMHEFGSQLVTLTRAERTGWLPLTIEVDGQQVRGIVGDGIEEVSGTTRAEGVTGKIGIFVSGDSRNEAPIEFRLSKVEAGRD